jgi:hypothetical protein
MDGLAALKSASFDWVMRLDDVWREQPYHVPELNAALREDILARCRQIGRDPRPTSPLGWVVLGPAGAGKTHLLGSLRREASAMALFILVDLTDVRDFWEALLVGYLSSLREPEERPQLNRLVADILRLCGQPADKAEKNAEALASSGLASLVKGMEKIVLALGQKYRRGVMQHQDVLRALFLLHSNDFTIGSLGYNFLQGLGLEAGEAASVGLKAAYLEPIRLVKGLSWVFSLRGPTVLALDQLDAIVREKHVALSAQPGNEPSDEQKAAQAIIDGLGLGLAALADHTSRTLTLVTCLESTWEVLRKTVLHSITDRYESPKLLRPMSGADMVTRLVSGRLAPAFAETGFDPPYATWPFTASAVAGASGLTPREVLKLCETHRRRCVEEGRGVELESLGLVDMDSGTGPNLDELGETDRRFHDAQKAARLDLLWAEDYEDELGRLLQAACRCLIREVPLPLEVDLLLETQFGGGQAYAPLHARLRLINVAAGAEETHICFRALQKGHHTAFTARLKAAMTFSGIDPRISFRRLLILRRDPHPTGAQTKKTIAAFEAAGGRFVDLTDENLAVLWALADLDQNPPPRFDEWLRERRPVSKLELMRTAVPELYEFGAFGPPPALLDALDDASPNRHAVLAAAGTEEKEPDWGIQMPLGRILDTTTTPKPVTYPVALLGRHVLILAGSGTGKTVLVRRLVESAALSGLPSVVVDSTGDLSRLGDPWPRPPRAWPGGEAALAVEYHRKARVMVYTPGRDEGRPLAFPAIPDFSAVKPDEDAETFEDLVNLAASDLADPLALGFLGRSKKKMAVLTQALRHLASRGGGDLADLARLLADPPDALTSGHSGTAKLAREMAQTLQNRALADPFFQDKAPLRDPGRLFALPSHPGRTLVSVLCLTGLPSAEARARFVGRLAAALYGWLPRRPPAGPTGVYGLLVIDDVDQYFPQGKTAVSKEALVKLVERARRYGLGLVLATRNPKDLDLGPLENVGTLFLGMANAPQSLKPIRRLLVEKGGDVSDLANLTPGRFVVHAAEAIHPPARIAVPMCLSYHPEEPLTREELIERAQGEPAATVAQGVRDE